MSRFLKAFLVLMNFQYVGESSQPEHSTDERNLYVSVY